MALTARTLYIFFSLITLAQCGTTVFDDCTKSGSFSFSNAMVTLAPEPGPQHVLVRSVGMSAVDMRY